MNNCEKLPQVRGRERSVDEISRSPEMRKSRAKLFYLDLFQYKDELVAGAEARALQYSLDLGCAGFGWMLMMMRRVTDLMSRVRGMRQRRAVLMVRRRRRRVTVMMMRRRVYVTVSVTHRMMMRTGGAVHIV